MTEISRRGIFSFLGAAVAAPLAKPEPAVAKPTIETWPDFGAAADDDMFNATCQEVFARSGPCLMNIFGNVHSVMKDEPIEVGADDDADDYDDYDEDYE